MSNSRPGFSETQTECLDLLHLGLAHADPLVAPHAACLLGELGCQASVRPLLAHIQQSARYNKNAAVDALRLVGDPAAAPALRELSENPGVWADYYWYYDCLLRSAASLAAERLDPGGGPSVLDRFLDQPSVAFSNFLLQYAPVIVTLPESSPVLTRLRHASVEEIFAPRSLRRPAEDLRRLKALGELGTGAALEKIRCYLDDPSRYVRGEALMQTVRHLDPEEALSFLRRLLERESDRFVRRKAEALLAAGGDAAAMERVGMRISKGEGEPLELTEGLETARRLKLRLCAGDLRHPLAHPAAPVRIAALSMLESLTGNAAQTLGGKFLADPDPRVRLQAAKACFVLAEEVAA